MLHAFKLGKLMQNWKACSSSKILCNSNADCTVSEECTSKLWYEAARQEGATGVGGIGTESYAFIPKNVLPYLQYLHDEDYCHIYMVDGPTALTDVSINKPSDCSAATDYWDCPKLITMKKVCSVTTTTACIDDEGCPSTETCVDSSAIDFTKTSWRTTLIGSMGIGGATCDAATATANRITTPLSGQSLGWSSYFALDVTNNVKWCAISKAACNTDSDCLPISTNGACVVESPKILWEFSHADLGVTNVGPAIVKVGTVDKNGRWFAILASGSTGPIVSKEFKGTSDKNLRLFVLDLKTGALLRTIDTGIPDAFAGSISTSALDLEKDRPGESGNYQDDAVYIGYVKRDVAATTPVWNKGGVLRLVINDDVNPANWTVSKVIDDIGPVTTSVVNLLDRKNGKLWLYFAEGRYFFKQDDLTMQRKLFGVQENCFTSASNSISSTCTTLALTNLRNQTTPSTTAFTAAEKGWYVNMNAAVSPISAERVISNPTPDTLGAIYFLSFAPTTDVCSFGGTTYLWALDYKTGGQVTFKMQGKALVQVSTGEIKELDLSLALDQEGYRKSAGFKGIPPTGQGLMVIKNPDPIKKFMHVQEQ